MRRAIFTSISSSLLLLSCAADEPVWVGPRPAEGLDTIPVSIQLVNNDNISYAMTLDIDGLRVIEGTVPDEDGGHCERWTSLFETRLTRGPHTLVVGGDEQAVATFEFDVNPGVRVDYSDETVRLLPGTVFCR